MEKISSREILEVLRNTYFKTTAVGLMQKKDVYNLTFIQRSTLIYLNKYDSMNMTDICKLLNVNKAALTRIIDTMERKKLVKRHKSQDDKRYFQIDMTPKGKDIVKKIDKQPLRVLDKLFSLCTKQEKESLIKFFVFYLKKLEELYQSK